MRDFVALVVGDLDSGHLVTPFFFKLSDFKIGPEMAFAVAMQVAGVYQRGSLRLFFYDRLP